VTRCALRTYLVNGKIPAYPPVVHADRPYHHGDLRRALLAEAVAVLAESGPSALSLRDLARRVGVSHAAPAHHFGDKTGLLTAVAAEGFTRLAERLRTAHETTGSFLEVGVAYVRFAVDHRGHFEVMYQPDLLDGDDPELAAARKAAAAALYGPAGEVGADADALEVGVAGWALMHGVAGLWLGGNLPAALGDDPEAIARSLGRHLFAPAASRARRPRSRPRR